MGLKTVLARTRTVSGLYGDDPASVKADCNLLQCRVKLGIYPGAIHPNRIT